MDVESVGVESRRHLTALMLLGPGPPMLCQAQDFVASAPFLYFAESGGLGGVALSLEAFVLRYFGGNQNRLLLVNLGRELAIHPAREPLLAPPTGADWRVRWSSEDPRYGGFGAPHVEGDESWHLPGQSAIVMRPERKGERDG